MLDSFVHFLQKGVKNMFFKFQQEMRYIFLEDINKHNLLAWIIYRTNYQEQYEDLYRYQCRITTRTVAADLNLPLATTQRLLKQLESEGYIVFVKKARSRHEYSIIFAHFIAKHDTITETVKTQKNTGLAGNVDTINETPSKNISKNKQKQKRMGTQL